MADDRVSLEVGGAVVSEANPLPTKAGAGADIGGGKTLADILTELQTLAGNKALSDIVTALAATLAVSQHAATPASGTLQNAQTGNANGTSLDVTGMSSVAFTVSITGTATVNFEGTEDGSTWVALNCGTLGDTSIASSTTTSGVFQAACAGLTAVRARTSGTSPTPSVMVTAHAVPVAWNSRVVKSQSVGGTLTDRSGTITSGGSAQNVCVANSARRYFFIQNNSTGDLWINFTTTAVASQPSVWLPPGASLSFAGQFVSTELVSIIGATTGQAFTAKEA